MQAGDAGVRRTEGGAPGWRKVVGAGAWRELVLYGGGRRIDDNCARCPAVAAAVDEVEEATSLALASGGEILLSVLDPGTHLRPHCGKAVQVHIRLTLG